ncbi:sigma-70 family RNA polymerase sigma factor [Caproiciproducens faecalis]|uniref:Sigma-70 family RNA polymerase sigma factor n=1 Tax=Caproiciproducens faecalis TaxID=2820301 RepID=A0ABS7DNA2_9FIRM|nr:sigma-70 family RNA polymerase sigma factor [Caproiciproducens faecalis]
MRRKSNLSLDLFGDRLYINKGEDDGGEHLRIRGTLRRAMEGELTERQRDCLQLRYFEQKSVQEVAEIIGVTPPTVSKHLKKARERLRRVMGYSFSRLN